MSKNINLFQILNDDIQSLKHFADLIRTELPVIENQFKSTIDFAVKSYKMSHVEWYQPYPLLLMIDTLNSIQNKIYNLVEFDYESSPQEYAIEVYKLALENEYLIALAENIKNFVGFEYDFIKFIFNSLSPKLLMIEDTCCNIFMREFPNEKE